MDWSVCSDIEALSTEEFRPHKPSTSWGRIAAFYDPMSVKLPPRIAEGSTAKGVPQLDSSSLRAKFPSINSLSLAAKHFQHRWAAEEVENLKSRLQTILITCLLFAMAPPWHSRTAEPSPEPSPIRAEPRPPE